MFEAPSNWGVYARHELAWVALEERQDRFGKLWVLVQSERLKAPLWLHHTCVKATTAAHESTAAV